MNANSSLARSHPLRAARVLLALSLVLAPGCILRKTATELAHYGSARDAALTGREFFVANVAPVFQEKCSSCHGGSTALSPFASRELDRAYAAARLLVNFADSGTSRLIPNAGNGHGNRSVNSADPALFRRLLVEWSAAELAVPPPRADTPSTLRRAQITIFADRLKGLFPTFDTRPLVDGQGLGQSLGNTDFNTVYGEDPRASSLAIGHFRYVIAQSCAETSVGLNRVFDSTFDTLLPGESLPTDPATQLAFIAARNVWRYPYVASDPEVQELRSIYVEQSQSARGVDATTGKKAVCLAALLAPQFWLGNPGRQDIVRRLAFDLGGRIPTLSEYAMFNSGALAAAAFAQQLTTTSGFRKLAGEWHRRWLELRDFRKYYGSGVNGDFKQFRGTNWGGEWSNGAGGGAQGQGAFFINSPLGGGMDELKLVRQSPYYDGGYHTDSEQCDPSVGEQAFDPETREIRWEMWDPDSLVWVTLGSWNRAANGSWSMTGRTITNTRWDPPVSVDVTLRDFVWANEVNRAPADRMDWEYRYVSDQSYTSRLIGTQFERFKVRHRRFVRIGSNGVPQNGYSRIKSWWSGKEVHVCNGITRFLATCQYRPVRGAEPPTQGGDAGPGFPFFTLLSGGQPPVARTLNLAAPEILPFVSDGGTWHKDSALHPVVLAGFSCGVPNPDALGSQASTVGTELLAYPKTAPYNTLATNIRGPWYGDYVYPGWLQRQEGDAVASVVDDLHLEPTRLIDSILDRRTDYRELLTANYTFGAKPYELLIRSQGYWIPKYPNGFDPIPTSGAYNWRPTGVRGDRETTYRRIDAAEVALMPRNWFRNANYSQTPNVQWPAANYSLDLDRDSAGNVIDEGIDRRSFSGLLTMPAFVGKTGKKVRSLSGQIFKALTCGDLNSFTPSASELAAHLRYVPLTEPGGGSHVADPGCLSCHINLDPLGAALSNRYLTATQGLAELSGAPRGGRYGGELENFVYHHGEAGWTFGIRGRSSKASRGAVLGQEVQDGVRGVGRVVSNSRAFASCAVKNAFVGVFGREPQSNEEWSLLVSVTDRFMTVHTYDYNKMVLDLVASEPYQAEN